MATVAASMGSAACSAAVPSQALLGSLVAELMTSVYVPLTSDFFSVLTLSSSWQAGRAPPCWMAAVRLQEPALQCTDGHKGLRRHEPQEQPQLGPPRGVTHTVFRITRFARITLLHGLCPLLDQHLILPSGPAPVKSNLSLQL